MNDQANELRQLVRLGSSRAVSRGRAPTRIVVFGAKGGVGATTIAVQLAMALADCGAQVVLVDADLNRADATRSLEVEPARTIADVLASRCSAAEALLQPGPAGLQILPGNWASPEVIECTPAGQDRLLAQLQSLGDQADVVVFDAGTGRSQVARRFWQAADHILLVTTPETTSIMDAYAAIKVFVGTEANLPVQTLINRSGCRSEAYGVHERIARACHRFLGLPIHFAGCVASEETLATTAERRLSQDLVPLAERLLAARKIDAQRGRGRSQLHDFTSPASVAGCSS